MIDTEFDITHCLSCIRPDGECVVCQDAFYGSKIFRQAMFFGPQVDTGRRFLIRYGQDKLLKEVAK